MPPVVIVTGAPGVGKSSVSSSLAKQFAKAVCIPVDDLRDWVVAGRSDPVPEWTDETARQFQLAEDAAADIAWRYHEAGFTVVFDHCRLPENIEAWVERSLHGLPVTVVALVPPVDVALRRNQLRDNKPFDTTILEPVIRSITQAYQDADLEGWFVCDSLGKLPEVVAKVHSYVQAQNRRT